MSLDPSVTSISRDEKWMQKALSLAREAENLGEVPVGAVVVLDNKIIGEGFNQPITLNDPSAHAEIIALRNAANNMANYRLVDAELFVTLEPCTMCAGAIVHSRIKRLIYGAKEPKSGVIESRAQILQAEYFNYTVSYTGGVCEKESSELISHFFSERRAEKKQKPKL